MALFAGLENCVYLFTRQYVTRKPPPPGRLEVKVPRWMTFSVDQQILQREKQSTVPTGLQVSAKFHLPSPWSSTGSVSTIAGHGRVWGVSAAEGAGASNRTHTSLADFNVALSHSNSPPQPKEVNDHIPPPVFPLIRQRASSDTGELWESHPNTLGCEGHSLFIPHKL